MTAAIAVARVNLAERPDTAGPCGQAAYLSFWWHALPVGAGAFVAEELPLASGTLAQLTVDLGAGQIAARDASIGALSSAREDGKVHRQTDLAAALAATGLVDRLDRLAAPARSGAALLSVVVCTRDRLADLARCLDRLLDLDAPPAEIIVVDNSADGSARTVVAARPPITYLHEPRAGLSIARNAGLRACRGELIAFTDDDTEPLPGWTAELVRAFDAAETWAVTGLVLPATLETEAQQDFQFVMGGFGGGFIPVRFDAEFFTRSLPHGCQVWRIGAGANMAFRRSALAAVGLFDERLGAGAAGCSEDSEIWYRILAAGGGCLFEPRAVVLHHHRADPAGLRRQLRAYMRGHVAALVVQYDRHRHRGNLKRIFGQLPMYLVGVGGRCLLEGRTRRLGLLWEEAIGWFGGLSYLLRPRWRRTAALPRLEADDGR